MMSAVVFLLSVLLLINSYLFLGRKLVSPATVSCATIALSTIIGFFFEDYWGVTLSWDTVIIIVGALFLIFFGNLVAYMWGKKFFCSRSFQVRGPYRLPDWFMGVYILFLFSMLYNYYTAFEYFLSFLNPNLPNTDILLMVNEAKHAGGEVIPFHLQVVTSVNNCLFIACLYCLIYNVVFFSIKKSDFKFFLPIMAYTGTSVLSSSRIDFLTPFLYAVTLSVMLYTYKMTNQPTRILKNVLLYVGVASIVFFAWFALLRYFRGGDFDVMNHFAIYISGGLYAFSAYYEGFINPFLASSTFGVHTFKAVYDSLASVGLHYNELEGLVSSTTFIETATFRTNVYSVFCALVEDFGVAGCWFVLFLLAVLMGAYQTCIDQLKYQGIVLIIFTETFTVFYMLPVTEMFFASHFISFSRIAHFVLIYLVLEFLIKKETTQ